VCGIAGFFNWNHPDQVLGLRRMTQPLVHRGPDAAGFFEENQVGLGHRRLSILDLNPRSHQPFHSACGRYVMVYNGEVYNFAELAQKHRLVLQTGSDTEVILALFAKIGADFVHELNGMFALAIYDRQLQSLFLCRDRIGVKPLFYFWDGTRFAFASEMKALYALPNLTRNIAPESIHHFLHLGYIPAPYTIYQQIYKLPPGHIVVVNGQGLQPPKPYWQAAKFLPVDEKGYLTDEKTAFTQLHELLKSAVAYRLIADVPVGVLLSGGIDSSLVAALAVAQSNHPIRTFSIGFEDQAHNEAFFAEQVAQKLGTQHETHWLNTHTAQEWVLSLTQIYDEPFADSSAIPSLLVSQVASQQLKVVLGGDGGDELFWGYGSYAWAMRLAQPWIKFARKPLSALLATRQTPSFQKAARLLRYDNRPYCIPSHIFSQEQFLFSQAELSEIGTPNSFKPQPFAPILPAQLSNPAARQAFFDLLYYLPDDLLVKIDRASMHFGLEVRTPLLDFRVVQFALQMASWLKINASGETKHLLKQVLFQYLPAALFKRPKQGFSIPLVDWLRGDLRFLLEDFLRPEVLKRHGWVDAQKVASMKKSYLEGNSFWYNRLWALAMLHKFLEEIHS